MFGSWKIILVATFFKLFHHKNFCMVINKFNPQWSARKNFKFKKTLFQDGLTRKYFGSFPFFFKRLYDLITFRLDRAITIIITECVLIVIMNGKFMMGVISKIKSGFQQTFFCNLIFIFAWCAWTQRNRELNASSAATAIQPSAQRMHIQYR